MSYETEFFARVEERSVQVACRVSLITIGILREGKLTETDIVLYRYRRHCPTCNSGKYEMIRFRVEHKETANRLFPYGPPYRHGGSPWKETTDWLDGIATMVLPARNGGLRRIENYPQELPPHFSP